MVVVEILVMPEKKMARGRDDNREKLTVIERKRRMPGSQVWVQLYRGSWWRNKRLGWRW
jgi:hypothetical protein